jgi:colanic acid/amylovoran biosynthesis glycosyltransferase
MKNKLSVIQSVPVWLPQTGTWLHDQVRFLPDDIESHVVCEITQRLDQFPFHNIHCLRDQPHLEVIWDLGMRKIGARRHLHFPVACARKYGARLMHSHFGNTGWQDLGAARAASLSHVVTFYGLDVNHLPTVDPRWRERYRELFRRVDCVLCEGEFMAASVVRLGCPEDKVRVHHLGVDVEAISFAPREWTPGQPLRVFMASVFREKKGIPYGLEALGRLQHDVPLEITIIGDEHGTVGTREEKKRILATIDKHDLGPRTRLLGITPYEVMRREALEHHVFMSPSVTAADGDSEGGVPVSIIEMCASGMPVVSTRHCDIPGVILDGKTGLLADERDVDGLVRGLRWLVEHPGEWSGMLAASRRRIEQEFDARTQATRLGAIYAEIAGAA